MTLRREVYVAGVGIDRFGRKAPSLADRIMRAGVAALGDAGVRFGQVETLYLGTALSSPTEGVVAVKDLGLTGIPVIRVENASASGAAAFYEAVHAVSGGRAEIAMAIGFDDPAATGTSFNAFRPGVPVLEAAIWPAAFFSMWAVRRMADRGTTAQTLARIAAKNWNNAALNPYAQRQSTAPVTPEEVLAARMLAYPHTAKMAAPMGGGAAAAVVVSADALTRLERQAGGGGTAGLAGGLRRVRVAAAQACSERYVDGHLFAGAIVGPPEMAHRAAYQAYEEAGIGPGDLSLVAVHDAYAIEELLYYEEIGLCGPGEGDALVHDGATELTGRIPVSTDGGFIGRGHPGGATGLAQIWELASQLRGTAGARQVPGARHGLAHIVGAGSVCFAHLLSAA